MEGMGMAKNYLLMPVLLVLAACATAPVPSSPQFQGTAIRLRSTPAICQHIQALKAGDGSDEDIALSLAELHRRGMSNLAAEEVMDLPPIGMSDNEVLCFWRAPDKIEKNLSADGAAVETWTYTKRKGLFGKVSQQMIFVQSRLARIGEMK